jgi:hypothetical protein
MTNTQVRLIASAIALLAGGVIANTTNIHVNISIVVILVSAAIFVVEYLRSQRESSQISDSHNNSLMCPDSCRLLVGESPTVETARSPRKQIVLRIAGSR